MTSLRGCSKRPLTQPSCLQARSRYQHLAMDHNQSLVHIQSKELTNTVCHGVYKRSRFCSLQVLLHNYHTDYDLYMNIFVYIPEIFHNTTYATSANLPSLFTKVRADQIRSKLTNRRAWTGMIGWRRVNGFETHPLWTWITFDQIWIIYDLFEWHKTNWLIYHWVSLSFESLLLTSMRSHVNDTWTKMNANDHIFSVHINIQSHYI